MPLRKRWFKSMPIIDANVILRYLLNDHAEMSPAARDIIATGAQTTVEVLAEVVYVLSGLYQTDRRSISEGLQVFINEISILEKPAVCYALKLYGLSNLDFVDCVLAGYHHVNGDAVATFDRKLLKAIEKNPIDMDR